MEAYALMKLTKPILEPIAQKFLDDLEKLGAPPIYTLSPEQARDVLVKIQEGGPALPVDVEERTIPGGPQGTVDIRIFKPAGRKEKLPAVLFCHGAGWILGDWRTHDRLMREIVIGAQCALVYVDFHRSPEAQFPVAIEEVYETLVYLSENGAQLNLDTSRLAIVGDSVGGNMAIAVTLLAKERGGPEIDYQVLFYPVTAANFDTDSYKQFAEGYWLSRKAMEWFWNAYLPDESAREQITASPLNASITQLQGLPPALIITGECDVLRDEGEAYAHKLMDAGVPTMAVRCQGIIHDFVMLNALAETQAAHAAMALATRQLKQALGTGKP